MDWQLNSEDEALLDAVERAIARKGEGLAEGDNSLEGFCGRLAASAQVADGGFRDELLSRLQGRLVEDPSYEGGASREGTVEQSADEQESGLAVVERDNRARIIRPQVRAGVSGRGGQENRWLRGALAVAGMAAMFVLFVGLAAMLGSRINQTFSRISSGLVPSSLATVDSADQLALMPTAAAEGTSYYFGFQVRPAVTVTPVDAAALVPKMAMLYRLPVQDDGDTVLWSPDGETLATRSGSVVQAWDMGTGELRYNLLPARASTYSMAWSPDGQVLAGALSDGGVELFSTADGARLATLSPPHTKGAQSTVLPAGGYPSGRAPNLAWAPDGRRLASVGGEPGNESDIYVWDVAKGSMAHNLSVSSEELSRSTEGAAGYVAVPDTIVEVGWSPGGTMLAALYTSHLIAVWDVANGKLLQTLFDPSTYGYGYNGALMLSMKWSPDGRTVAQTRYNFVEMWDAGEWRERTLPDPRPLLRALPGSMPTIDPEIAKLTPTPVDIYKAEAYDALHALAWSPRGDAVATLDGLFNTTALNLRLWEPGSGRETYRLKMEPQLGIVPLLSLEWSPDGQVLAYSTDGIKLWNVGSKSEMRTLQVPYSRGAWWSPDGSMLAVLGAVGYGAFVEVWGDPAAPGRRAPPTAVTPAAPVCGEWSPVDAPSVDRINELRAVAAVSDEDVWAVGYHSLDPVFQLYEPQTPTIKSALTMRWDGQKWQNVPAPRAGEANNRLMGVAGVAANDVWAVGYYGDYEGVVPYQQFALAHSLIMHWDGVEWSVVPAPEVGKGSNRLLAVAGVAADDVWAVGYAGGDYELMGVAPPPTPTGPPGTGEENAGSTGVIRSVPLILHWDGTKWSVVESPVAGTERNELHAVSALGRDAVWAVGIAGDTPPLQIGMIVAEPLVLAWDGKAWKQQPTPNVGNTMSGISAASGDAAWAVGSFVTEGSSNMAMLRWDGKNWSAVDVPGKPGDENDPPSQEGLQSVLARGPDDVWAVGSTVSAEENGYSPVTMALHWDGVEWSKVATPSLAEGSGNNSLRGLAGAPSGDVWAVGTYNVNDSEGYKIEPLVLRYDSSGCGGP